MLCNRIQSFPEQYRARQELPPLLAACCRLCPRPRPGPLQVPSRGEGACRVVWPAFAVECQDLGGHNDGWRGSNTESRRAGSKRMWCWAWPSEGWLARRLEGEETTLSQRADESRSCRGRSRVQCLVSRASGGNAMEWGRARLACWLLEEDVRRLSRSPTASSCCVSFFLSAAQHRFPLSPFPLLQWGFDGRRQWFLRDGPIPRGDLVQRQREDGDWVRAPGPGCAVQPHWGVRADGCTRGAVYRLYV